MSNPSALSALASPASSLPQASARPAESGQPAFDQVLAREVAGPPNPAQAAPVASATPAGRQEGTAGRPPANGSDKVQDKVSDEESESAAADSTPGEAGAASLAQFLALAAQLAQATPAAKPSGPKAVSAGVPGAIDGGLTASGKLPAPAALAAEAGLVPDEPVLQASLDPLALAGQAGAKPARPDAGLAAAEPTLPAFTPLTAARAAPELVIPPSASHPAARLAPPVGANGWDQALGQRVIWMAGNAQHSASLTLNPPDLGPLQVVLSVSDSQATANFFSTQPEVRQALEAAMPRLRDMLGSAGIELGQASVSGGDAQQPGMGDGSGTGRGRHASGGGQGGADTILIASGTPGTVREGLVNTFA